MAKIWVHIDPTVTAEGGGAKLAFTESAKEKIQERLVSDIEKELPAKILSTKDADKPKGKPKAHEGAGAHNAIAVRAEQTFGIETAGKKMTVNCTLRVVFEAIRYPNLKPGMLLVSGRTSAPLDGQGTDEKAFLSLAKDLLDAINRPLVKKLAADPRLASNGKMHGVPFD